MAATGALEAEGALAEEAGTIAAGLSVMFLVFMSLVTFFNPDVTASPLLRALKTEDISPLAGVEEVGVALAKPAGGGGGGPGGGGPPAEGAAAAETLAEAASPPLGFHASPVVWKFLM